MPKLAPDRYQLIRRLESTPLVQSYEAVHPRRPGRFLVEVLLGLRGEPDAHAAFEREVAAMAALRHPHVQQTFEIASLPDGTPIMVSELPEGVTLQAWLDEGKDVPPEATVALVSALADALASAHAHDVHHGDVTAANVSLVAGTGWAGAIALPKLRGFGTRWLQGGAASPTGGATAARAADVSALA